MEEEKDGGDVGDRSEEDNVGEMLEEWQVEQVIVWLMNKWILEKNVPRNINLSIYSKKKKIS